MNTRILIASLLVVIVGLMAGLYFAFVWPSTIGNSSSITVMGKLEPGIEAGCTILLTDDGTQYLLLGWSGYPPAGTRVTVTGYFDNNAASYCMQGEAAIHVVSIYTSELTTSRSSTESVSYATGTVTASSATVISASTQQSTTITFASITINGYIYTAAETPQVTERRRH